jgi:hypothetical protein
MIADLRAAWVNIHKFLSEKLPKEFKFTLEDYLKA